PELSTSTALLAELNADYSVTQEVATAQKSSGYDSLIAELQATHTKIDDSISSFGAVARGDEASRLEEVKKLIADYRGVQQSLLKATADLQALPAGAGDAQRSALAD